MKEKLIPFLGLAALIILVGLLTAYGFKKGKSKKLTSSSPNFVFYQIYYPTSGQSQVNKNQGFSVIKKISLDKKQEEEILTFDGNIFAQLEDQRLIINTNSDREIFNLEGQRLSDKKYNSASIISPNGQWQSWFIESPTETRIILENLQKGNKTEISPGDLPDSGFNDLMPLAFSQDSQELYLRARKFKKGGQNLEKEAVYLYDLSSQKFKQVYQSPAKELADLTFEESNLKFQYINPYENWLLVTRQPLSEKNIKEEILKLDLNSNKALSLFKIEKPSPYQLYTDSYSPLSPDFSHLILTTSDQEVALAHIKTNQIEKLNLITNQIIFSPDSNYLIYTQRQENQITAIKVYNLKDKQTSTLVEKENKNQILSLIGVNY